MAAVTTAIKNANTGVSTAAPGIIDHTAQIGRLTPRLLWKALPISPAAQ
jgi:hypothetical protein